MIIACAGELVADLEVSWLTEERKKHLQRRSTILLVAALSVSLICLVRANELSGSVIGSLGDKAEEAETKAQSALDKSILAENKAGTATEAASTAFTKAVTADSKAGDADRKAVHAEIVSERAVNKANAANAAASHALALARTTEDNVAWRKLTKAQEKEIGNRLKQFPVQVGYIECLVTDLEAISFSSDIYEALGQTHWKVRPVNKLEQLLEGGRETFGPLSHGVLIVSSPDVVSHRAAAALLDELRNKFGFDAARRPDDDVGNNIDPGAKSWINIKVEPRPAGPQGAAKLRVEAEKRKANSSHSAKP